MKITLVGHTSVELFRPNVYNTRDRYFVQMGGMGIGDPYVYCTDNYKNGGHRLPKTRSWSFMTGEHDNHGVACRMPQYLGDWFYEHRQGILYVSKYMSKNSYIELGNSLIPLAIHPETIVSWMAPSEVLLDMFGVVATDNHMVDMISKVIKPKKWLFSGMSKRKTKQIGPTKYISVGWDEYVNIN